MVLLIFCTIQTKTRPYMPLTKASHTSCAAEPLMGLTTTSPLVTVDLLHSACSRPSAGTCGGKGRREREGRKGRREGEGSGKGGGKGGREGGKGKGVGREEGREEGKEGREGGKGRREGEQ